MTDIVSEYIKGLHLIIGNDQYIDLHKQANALLVVLEQQQSDIKELRELLGLAIQDLKSAVSTDCENTTSCKYCKFKTPKGEAPYCLSNNCETDDWRWQHADRYDAVMGVEKS